MSDGSNFAMILFIAKLRLCVGQDETGERDAMNDRIKLFRRLNEKDEQLEERINQFLRTLKAKEVKSIKVSPTEGNFVILIHYSE
jgi:hypothetical protein